MQAALPLTIWCRSSKKNLDQALTGGIGKQAVVPTAQISAVRTQADLQVKQHFTAGVQLLALGVIRWPINPEGANGLRGGRRLYRTLNSRQFGLKLIANVTYGYTGLGVRGSGVRA